MKNLFLCLIIFFSVLLASFTTIPIFIDVLIILYIYNRNDLIFIIALISGLLIDSILIRTIGISSIFFIFLLFLLSLYEKKFEVKTIHFVLFFSFIASFSYLFLFKQNYVLQQAIVNSLIAAVLFIVSSRMYKKRMLSSDKF